MYSIFVIGDQCHRLYPLLICTLYNIFVIVEQCHRLYPLLRVLIITSLVIKWQVTGLLTNNDVYLAVKFKGMNIK